MELYRIWRICVAYAWLLFLLPVVATVVGLGLSYVLPEQYKSTALVLVRPNEELKFDTNGGGDKEALDFPVGRSAPLDAPSKTYMEVIKSPAVAVKIVEALHLDVKHPLEGGTTFERLKEQLKEWIVNTNRTLTNYFKYGRDIPATPFELAIEEVEQKLEVAVRKDTYAFDISYQSGDPGRAAAVANMAAQIFTEHSTEAYRSEAERAREFIEARLDESQNVLERSRAALLAYKSTGGTFDLTSEYTERLKNVSDLQNTLAKAEGKLAGVKRAFRSDSPEVLAQEAENAALKSQIAALQAALVEYPQKEARVNADALALRLAEQSYEFFRKRYEEARVKESAVVSEIRIVSPAEAALYPTKPLKYLFGGVSFAVGLVLAIAWALLAEQLNPRVRTVHDLDEDVGVPVLGAIPTLRMR